MPKLPPFPKINGIKTPLTTLAALKIGQKGLGGILGASPKTSAITGATLGHIASGGGISPLGPLTKPSTTLLSGGSTETSLAGAFLFGGFKGIKRMTEAFTPKQIMGASTRGYAGVQGMRRPSPKNSIIKNAMQVSNGYAFKSGTTALGHRATKI